MSYARFTDDSDVYIFLSVNGDLECCSCRLKGQGQCSTFATTDLILGHLQRHLDAGHQVPAGSIERLKAEREDNDAYIMHVRSGRDGDDFEWRPDA